MAGVDPDLTDEPRALAEAARRYLRHKFLAAEVAISGANFAVAETGTLAVVESEGNGRMCLTLPRTLITVMGIEKVVPTWRDLEVFLQLLPRSSTGERMNPYTSMWTGATEGQDFHLVLLDNGRTATLADPRGRAALRCIRCSACLNVCPVYERTGGHAYGSVYPGPIGAVLSPQLTGGAGRTPRCRSPRRCAAPATTSARSPSTSRRCSCTCGPGWSRTRAATPESGGHARGRRDHAPSRAAGAGRCGCPPRRGRSAWRAAGWRAAPPLSALDGQSRDLPTPPQQTCRDWWRPSTAGP